MSDLSELYQEVILDHNRKPRNFGKLEGANRTAEGYNPLCGDHYTVYLLLDDGVIRDVRFEGVGCAISKASASMMTTTVKGKRPDEAETLFQDLHRVLTAGPDADVDVDKLGKLAVLVGVREYPTRIKCASLGWHAMHAALQQKDGVAHATTE